MRKTLNLVLSTVLALACEAQPSDRAPSPSLQTVAEIAEAKDAPKLEDDPAPKTDLGVPAPAEPPATTKNIVIVLDASGSMRARREGHTKIDIARDSLDELLTSLPDGDFRAGLIAYGHREKKSCDDIELIAPVVPLDRERLRSRGREIRPRGKTPVSSSLEQAGKQLAPLDGDKAIVLLTDGENNCSGDPVSTARRLHEEHGIRTHVISFDVLEVKPAIALREIATAGNGGYFTAATIEGLDEMSKRVATAIETGKVSIDQTVQENFEIILDQSVMMDVNFLYDRKAINRFALAKGALDSVLRGLAADRDNMALRRMGSDCTNSPPEPIVPFDLNRGPEIRARVASAEVEGSDRALVDALLESARDFNRAGVQAPLSRRVVVITSGADSCSTRPERMAELRRLSESSGSPIRYHFIGVMIDEAAYADLDELATDLGGSAWRVATQKQLEEVLELVFEAEPAANNLDAIVKTINDGIKRFDDGMIAMTEHRLDEARAKAQEAKSLSTTTLPFRDLARRRSRRQYREFFKVARELRDLQRMKAQGLISMIELQQEGDFASVEPLLEEDEGLRNRYNEEVARANRLLRAIH